MAGGRISAADITKLAQAGLKEIHVGSAACTGEKTDVEKVRRIAAAAR
jgi:copper homeostasis protein